MNDTLENRIVHTTALLIEHCKQNGIRVSGDFRGSERDAEDLLGLGVSVLKRWRLKGNAPHSYRCPMNSCRYSYRMGDLAA